MKNLENNDPIEKEISIDQVLGKKWFALGSVVAALCSLCCFIASMGKISSTAMIMTYFTFGFVTAIALFMYDGARLSYRKVNGLKEYKFPFYGALYSASYFAITFLSFSNYAVYFPAMLALLFITGLALLFKKEPTKSVDVSLFTKVKSWVKSISSGKAPIAIMGIILALTIHESSNMNNQTGFSVFVRIVLFLMIIIYSILRLVKSEEYYHQAVLNASRFDKHGSILVYFANAVICAAMFLTLAVYCIRDLRFNSFFAIFESGCLCVSFLLLQLESKSTPNHDANLPGTTKTDSAVKRSWKRLNFKIKSGTKLYIAIVVCILAALFVADSVIEKGQWWIVQFCLSLSFCLLAIIYVFTHLSSNIYNSTIESDDKSYGYRNGGDDKGGINKFNFNDPFLPKYLQKIADEPGKWRNITFFTFAAASIASVLNGDPFSSGIFLFAACVLTYTICKWIKAHDKKRNTDFATEYMHYDISNRIRMSAETIPYAEVNRRLFTGEVLSK